MEYVLALMGLQTAILGGIYMKLGGLGVTVARLERDVEKLNQWKEGKLWKQF